MRYRPISSMPGPGDFYSPEELDDDTCRYCGGLYECVEDCTCKACLPFSCSECAERSAEQEHLMSEIDEAYLEDDCTICTDCFNQLMEKGNKE